jgi:aspartate racemase
MKTIGILGGMSWESTKEYYRLINELTRDHFGGLKSAKMIVYSFDFEEIARMQTEARWEEAGELLAKTAVDLERAGAEIMLIATNTMHKLADYVERAISGHFLHIADATADKVKELGVRTVGLLGTRYTMQQDFYRQRLESKHGLTVLTPDSRAMDRVNELIFAELCQGVVKDSSVIEFKEIIAALGEDGAEAMLLACTELPMLIKQDLQKRPYILDTMQLHAEAAFKLAIAEIS